MSIEYSINEAYSKLLALRALIDLSSHEVEMLMPIAISLQEDAGDMVRKLQEMNGKKKK